MKYDYLTPEEQLAMLRPRIAGLERDHYNLTLDGEVSGTNNERVLPVEAAIEVLRVQAETLEAEIAQRQEA